MVRWRGREGSRNVEDRRGASGAAGPSGLAILILRFVVSRFGIGDDTLQKNAERRVTPESFTHGSSGERVKWFTAGRRSGDVGACDTFTARAP